MTGLMNSVEMPIIDKESIPAIWNWAASVPPPPRGIWVFLTDKPIFLESFPFFNHEVSWDFISGGLAWIYGCPSITFFMTRSSSSGLIGLLT